MRRLRKFILMIFVICFADLKKVNKIVKEKIVKNIIVI